MAMSGTAFTVLRHSTQKALQKGMQKVCVVLMGLVDPPRQFTCQLQIVQEERFQLIVLHARKPST